MAKKSVLIERHCKSVCARPTRGYIPDQLSVPFMFFQAYQSKIKMQYQYTVNAPLTTKVTIQKLIFQILGAASFQERPQFEKYISLVFYPKKIL